MNNKHRSIITAISIALGVIIIVFPALSLAADAPTLPNPVGKNVSLIQVMLRAMQIALGAVGIFALFMFVLGGFEFLISAGNPNLVKKAKDTLLWATLGILVIVFSYSILKFIFESVRF